MEVQIIFSELIFNFGPLQNEWNPSKTNWTSPKLIGSIDGKAIHINF